MSLEGKLITITGAASGIAQTTARLLASKKALLSLADIQEAPLFALASELADQGAQVYSQAVDVTDRGSVEAWIKRTVELFGRPIDGVANLAGIICKSIYLDAGSIRNLSDEEFDSIFAVHVKGTFNCLRAQLPYLKKGRDGRNGGSIVNCSSVAGLLGFKNNAAYAAAKAGVAAMTKCCAREEGVNGIRANAIAPGIIETPMMYAAMANQAPEPSNISLLDYTAPGRTGSAEEVANLIAFLLSNESSYITGMIYTIDGGYSC